VVIKRAVCLGIVLSVALSIAIACSSGGNSKAVRPTPGPATALPTRGSGPQASIDPKSAPPGTEVAILGTGWPALSPILITAAENPTNAPPYAQLTTDKDGSFVARFRLEKAPDGTALQVGRFNLLAHGTTASVTIAFQVETARPVRNPGDGG
jgi:hypothetical protein